MIDSYHAIISDQLSLSSAFMHSLYHLSSLPFSPSLQTFPEIIPFIEVCVKMMEQVYNVPVDIDGGVTSTSEARPPTQVPQYYCDTTVYLCICTLSGVPQP